eukprot:scaffold194694_cov15-Prasinocladus_malaysianus.AAC.1
MSVRPPLSRGNARYSFPPCIRAQCDELRMNDLTNRKVDLCGNDSVCRDDSVLAQVTWYEAAYTDVWRRELLHWQLQAAPTSTSPAR